MSIIFITEKPSVAQEYKKVLKISQKSKTNGYVEGNSPVMNAHVIVTWAVGHLVSLCGPEKQDPKWAGPWNAANLRMIPDRYKYEPLPQTADQFGVVKSLFTRSDVSCIYYAGDSGREGVYIQALIRNQIFQTKKPAFEEKIVWISSFSEPAILEGIKNAKPYAAYQNLINSGYVRAISDWLIGMNFTRAFTLTARNLINTGRVITPTLAMVVDRQKEIDGFTKTEYYGIQADTGTAFGTVLPAWKAVSVSNFYNSPILYNENGFLHEADAKKLCDLFNQNKRLTVANVTVKEKKEYPPYLFNLADLQAFCAKNFKISPADTLQILQKLYEEKYTTYPRTDSRFLDTKTAGDLKRHGYAIPSRYINDDKVSDHYAIIPDVNGKGIGAGGLNGLALSVYEAVCRRFLDVMEPPCISDAVSITLAHPAKECFFASFQNVKQAGFKKNDPKLDLTIKPVPQKGSVVSVSAFLVHPMQTKPPAAYTTGTLIMAMEKAGKLIEDEELREQIKTCGIGTSATRAEIIKRLCEKGFITIDKKQKITPTELGMAVIPVIAGFDETLVSPVKTAKIEQDLFAIADGTLSVADFLRAFNAYVKDTTLAILAAGGTGSMPGSTKTYSCPHCKGDVVKGRFAWYCKNKCGFSPQKVYGHSLTDAQIESLLSGKQISFTQNGRKTIVNPDVVPNEWQGKTYFNWRTGK